MRQYEVMYILKADLEDAKRQEVVDTLHASDALVVVDDGH